MTKKSSNQNFGRQLKELRTRQNLTVREFAARCRCAFNFITMIENGHWGCGPGLLGRMAKALNLQGEERVKFMLAGLTTSRTHPLLPEVEEFHPVLLNALGLWLRENGVTPRNLRQCTWKSKVSRTQLLKLASQCKRLAQLWEKRANSMKPDELADGPEVTFRLSSGGFIGVSLAKFSLGTPEVV